MRRKHAGIGYQEYYYKVLPDHRRDNWMAHLSLFSNTWYLGLNLQQNGPFSGSLHSSTPADSRESEGKSRCKVFQLRREWSRGHRPDLLISGVGARPSDSSGTEDARRQIRTNARMRIFWGLITTTRRHRLQTTQSHCYRAMAMRVFWSPSQLRAACANRTGRHRFEISLSRSFFFLTCCLRPGTFEPELSAWLTAFSIKLA